MIHVCEINFDPLSARMFYFSISRMWKIAWNWIKSRGYFDPLEVGILIHCWGQVMWQYYTRPVQNFFWSTIISKCPQKSFLNWINRWVFSNWIKVTFLASHVIGFHNECFLNTPKMDQNIYHLHVIKTLWYTQMDQSLYPLSYCIKFDRGIHGPPGNFSRCPVRVF